MSKPLILLKALLDGFDEVIPKPCLPDELAAVIDRLLVDGPAFT